MPSTTQRFWWWYLDAKAETDNTLDKCNQSDSYLKNSMLVWMEVRRERAKANENKKRAK
jgi:hypothetical protein